MLFSIERFLGAVRGVLSAVGGVGWFKRYSRRGGAFHGVAGAWFVADFWNSKHHHLLKLSCWA